MCVCVSPCCGTCTDLRIDGSDFCDLPRISMEEMRREIRDKGNVPVATAKLSEFISTPQASSSKASKDARKSRSGYGAATH